MDCAGRDVPIEPDLHFLQNRTPVGVFAQPDDGEENRLLEGTKDVGHTCCLHCR